MALKQIPKRNCKYYCQGNCKHKLAKNICGVFPYFQDCKYYDAQLKFQNYSRICIRCNKYFKSTHRCAKICEDCKKTPESVKKFSVECKIDGARKVFALFEGNEVLTTKKIKSLLPEFSYSGLQNYLKILLNDNRIERERVGMYFHYWRKT
jgi:hypothetical protein